MEEWFSRFFQDLQLQLGLRDPKLTAPEKNISGIFWKQIPERTSIFYWLARMGVQKNSGVERQRRNWFGLLLWILRNTMP